MEELSNRYTNSSSSVSGESWPVMRVYWQSLLSIWILFIGETSQMNHVESQTQAWALNLMESCWSRLLNISPGMNSRIAPFIRGCRFTYLFTHALLQIVVSLGLIFMACCLTDDRVIISPWLFLSAIHFYSSISNAEAERWACWGCMPPKVFLFVL